MTFIFIIVTDHDLPLPPSNVPHLVTLLTSCPFSFVITSPLESTYCCPKVYMFDDSHQAMGKPISSQVPRKGQWLSLPFYFVFFFLN